MESQLTQRLTELKSEFEKGQGRLKELETETGSLRQTLLRISGAIQVLEEELKKHQDQDTPAEPVEVVSEINGQEA